MILFKLKNAEGRFYRINNMQHWVPESRGSFLTRASLAAIPKANREGCKIVVYEVTELGEADTYDALTDAFLSGGLP